MKPHILLVEDDLNTRIALSYWLQQAGYRVTQASDGEVAFDLLENDVYDVVLTDIVLGDIDGIEVLQAARMQSYSPEVLILTGHGTLDTAIAAIRAGAYDYLVKPCDEDELLRQLNGAVQRRRVEAQRRMVERQLMDSAALLMSIHPQGEWDGGCPVPSLGPSEEVAPPNAPSSDASAHASPHLPALPRTIHIGELSIGDSRHAVSFRGEPVRLTPIEYALLCCLAKNPGTAHPYRHIVRHTHRFETDEADAQMLVKQHIFNLRKKIDPAYLVNDRGRGYMLVDPARHEAAVS
ncbi:MAG: response regulator transcription factor [Chloroflexaceae bacterium]|nr:response regulator transcription factor [Chloroflexaceae bacterium]